MTKNEWESLFRDAMQSLRDKTFVPYDTGNLKFNAIKGMWVSAQTFRIYIDEEVAPYVFYTQEPWINRPGINPNQGWVEKAVDYIANYIAHRLGGTTSKK